MKALAALLGLFVCAGAGAEASWYRSDALGEALDQAEASAKTPGWILRIEPRTGGEERTLFQDGVVQLVRLVDLDPQDRVLRVRDLRGGEAVWEVAYDPETGLPTTETSFEANKPVEISTLEFDGKTLSRRVVRNPRAEILFTDNLWRWPDGSLRRLERDGPKGPLAEASWSYGARGRLQASWATDEDSRQKGEHKEWLYAEGQTTETLAKGAESLESRVTEWLDNGGSRETRSGHSPGEKIIRTFDPRGNLVAAVVTVKDVVTQTRKWSFDPTGRVIRSSAEAGGMLEEWGYIYNGDGTVTGRLSRNGGLVREEILRDGEKIRVSLYDQGSLFLVETWTGGKRVKESYYSQGVLVRERAP